MCIPSQEKKEGKEGKEKATRKNVVSRTFVCVLLTVPHTRTQTHTHAYRRLHKNIGQCTLGLKYGALNKMQILYITVWRVFYADLYFRKLFSWTVF